jgi:hypothetical protein
VYNNPGTNVPQELEATASVYSWRLRIYGFEVPTDDGEEDGDGDAEVVEEGEGVNPDRR